MLRLAILVACLAVGTFADHFSPSPEESTFGKTNK